MKLGQFALLLALSAAACHSWAEGETGSAGSPGVIDKVEKAVVRSAKATANGIERGAKATAKGIDRAAAATANGVERGAQATASAANQAAKKLGAYEEPAHAK